MLFLPVFSKTLFNKTSIHEGTPTKLVISSCIVSSIMAFILVSHSLINAVSCFGALLKSAQNGKFSIIIADKSLWTLYHVKFQKHFKCEHGGDGSKSRSSGLDGKDVFIYDKIHVTTTISREDNTFGFSFLTYSRAKLWVKTSSLTLSHITGALLWLELINFSISDKFGEVAGM